MNCLFCGRLIRSYQQVCSSCLDAKVLEERKEFEKELDEGVEK